MPTTLQVQWIASSVSAVVAGLVAVGATVAIEKLGGMLGGVLASTPTTIVPSILGITFSGASSDDIFLFGMNVPPALLLNSCVLFIWKLVSERLPAAWSFASKLGTLVGSVLLFWFVGAAAVVFGLEKGLAVPALALGVTSMVLHAVFGLAVLFLSPAAAPKGANKVKPVILVLRGACAMLTIFLGSVIARTQPSIGGLVSCFPSIYLTTLISVWVAQGDKVTAGATGPMILGGLSVSIYAVAFPLLFPRFGWLSSALMAYLIAVLGWSIPIALLLRWWSARNAAIYAAHGGVQDSTVMAKIGGASSVDDLTLSSSSSSEVDAEPQTIPLDEIPASPQLSARQQLHGKTHMHSLNPDEVVVKLDFSRT